MKKVVVTYSLLIPFHMIYEIYQGFLKNIITFIRNIRRNLK